MALLYYSAEFLNHDTGVHPENAGRLLPAIAQIQKSEFVFPFVRPPVRPISDERLERIHPRGYIESVQRLAASGGGTLDEDTVVSAVSFEVARLAAGGVCDAVQRVLEDADERRAFCLSRPPGHHALPEQAMGFCLFANVALGARVALDEFGLDRVLIVDWDVHHGNGTQDIFWEDPRVGFLSIHRYPFYPGTGATDETGGGPGLGTTVNVPLEYGIGRREYLAAFTSAVEKLADRVRPQLVLISAGFDAHRLDPVGSLGLESEDFGPLTRVVVNVANVHAGGRVVSVLEGGYDPRSVAESIDAHLHELCVDE